MPLPCKTCLVSAICKSEVQERGTILPFTNISKLMAKCDLLDEYINDIDETKGLFIKKINRDGERHFKEQEIIIYSRKYEAYKFFFSKQIREEFPVEYETNNSV